MFAVKAYELVADAYGRESEGLKSDGARILSELTTEPMVDDEVSKILLSMAEWSPDHPDRSKCFPIALSANPDSAKAGELSRISKTFCLTLDSSNGVDSVPRSCISKAAL